MTKILFIHQTIARHDAIGNDIYYMYRALRNKHDCYVFCDYLQNEEMARVDKKLAEKIISDPANLIIYHHSQYWDEGEKILDAARAKIILKYHNITPPYYFSDYSGENLFKCAAGREQTARLIKKFGNSLWMGDSLYNLRDIDAVAHANKVVVPPFNNISEMQKISPDDGVLKNLLKDNTINLLFVGRIVPNKGHSFLFRIVKDIINNYSEEVCLHLIGKGEDFKSYDEELRAEIVNMNIMSNVRFVGETSDAVILSYYLGCDFLLCGSEHEGFCLPLIEAQFCHLPVIARNSSAIMETIGDNQLVLGENIPDYSAAIQILAENRDYRNFLIENGSRNYNSRFNNDTILEKFKAALERFIGN